MTCAEVQPRISAYHDGELEPAERELIAAHLVECASCREYLEDLASIGELLHVDQGSEVPAALWGRIAAGAIKVRRSRPVALRGWLSRAAAVAAGFVVYMFGYDLMLSTLKPERHRSAPQAKRIEQVLHETGLAMAGSRPVGGQMRLLENRPEARLLAEFFEEATP